MLHVSLPVKIKNDVIFQYVPYPFCHPDITTVASAARQRRLTNPKSYPFQSIRRSSWTAGQVSCIVLEHQLGHPSVPLLVVHIIIFAYNKAYPSLLDLQTHPVHKMRLVCCFALLGLIIETGSAADIPLDGGVLEAVVDWAMGTHFTFHGGESQYRILISVLS